MTPSITCSLALASLVMAAGCALSHEAPSTASDAGVVSAHDAGTTIVDAGAPEVDAGETLYSLTTGDCFTFATRAIVHGGGMRCGDFTLEGPFVPYLVGVDGTLCELPGTYATLASVPTTVEGGCGRVINLYVGDGTNVGFIVRLGAHLYRVHVLGSGPPSMVFSFDEVTT